MFPLQRKLLETKLSENLVFKEYEEIAKKVAGMECSVASLPENSPRNRFRDVMPYDATRVKITPRKDNHSGYINASHVKVHNSINASHAKGTLLRIYQCFTCFNIAYFNTG